jgi:SAM-dependent methyltransferase
MMGGHHMPQVLYVAARLGLADLLEDGPRDAAALARAAGAHAPSLFRLLRALASLGVLERTADGRFALTALGACLRSDAPDSQRAWVLTMGDLGYRTWGELFHSVQTGRPAFARVFGAAFYDYVAAHPDAARTWDQLMDESAAEWLVPVAEACDFSGIGTLVDVGGGHGTFLAAALRANPALRGVLFDLPHVVAGAPPVLAAAGVADRCEVVGGDMRAGVPPGGDAYSFARVLFNWPDDIAAAVLRRCRRAMRPDGVVLIVERLMPEDDPPPGLALNDLGLLVSIGGGQRTETEFRDLLAGAGFVLTGCARVRGNHVLRARRAGASRLL